MAAENAHHRPTHETSTGHGILSRSVLYLGDHEFPRNPDLFYPERTLIELNRLRDPRPC